MTLSLGSISQEIKKNSLISIQAGVLLNQKTNIKKIEEKSPDSDLSYSNFNYSLGVYTKKSDWYIGFIYHVISKRIYGYIELDSSNNKRETMEFQTNNYLIGLGTRKILQNNNKSKLYLKLDLGLSMTDIDDESANLIGNPLSDNISSGFGGNIGFGLMIKNKIDFSFFSSIRQNQQSNESYFEDSVNFNNMILNASLGILF